jgi:hypothetical protein
MRNPTNQGTTFEKQPTVVIAGSQPFAALPIPKRPTTSGHAATVAPTGAHLILAQGPSDINSPQKPQPSPGVTAHLELRQIPATRPDPEAALPVTATLADCRPATSKPVTDIRENIRS